MPALAIPIFALAWWAACYLISRDAMRGALVRSAAALTAYAIGVAAWTASPDSPLAQILLCVPALFWAGAAVALLPGTLPERRQIDVGWLVLSVSFLAMVVALPSAGRLVVLAPLAGGLVLLWRFGDQVQPPMLPAAMSVVAALYGVGLTVLLLPIDLGEPLLVLSAIGVDLVMLAFLVAVSDSLYVGERLRADLLRSVTAAVLGTVVVGGPAVATVVVADSTAVTLVQFGLVALVMTGIALFAQLRRGVDRIAFRGDDRLRTERAALMSQADALLRHRQRHRLITTRPDDFTRFTRQALDNYHHLGRLMRSPLTDLPAVDRRLGSQPRATPLARALELRALLTDGVERLRPAGAFATSDEWRHFNALHFVVVLGLDPYARRQRTDGLDREERQALDWMRRYVPRRRLRRWQQEAAAIVARRLWDELTSADPRWLTTRGTNSLSPERNG
ncbi:hypothetical protein GCM10010172_21420 [Paractinoplanes ferrugineus]|uniref:Uncharacterized protein n=1 Tax=Paractinoplanes ferrugineus TaxID=113564 RepID=A0A919IW65_9ACTN|nr:hypothetical protein Afe05nite_07870 [Actinoplanes ferrugineus]